jgi:hypothetical protein
MKAVLIIVSLLSALSLSQSDIDKGLNEPDLTGDWIITRESLEKTLELKYDTLSLLVEFSLYADSTMKLTMGYPAVNRRELNGRWKLGGKAEVLRGFFSATSDLWLIHTVQEDDESYFKVFGLQIVNEENGAILKLGHAEFKRSMKTNNR